MTIISEDEEALDEFAQLLNAMAESATAGREIAVFFIKHAQAATVAQMLDQIMGGGTTAPERPAANGFSAQSYAGNESSGDGAAGRRGAGRRDFAGANGGTSGSQGSPTGSQAFSGGAVGNSTIGQSALATGPIKITSDKRLNALFVQANRADLDSINRLLKVLDVPESPIALASKPRMIPVLHTRASEIAEILRQVYVDRLLESPDANQPMMPGGPMAAMFVRNMRGQQQQGNGQRGRDDVVKLSLGVDTRSNAVIVGAPDSLFEEVRQLVGQLDTAAATRHDQTVVVAMHGTSLAAVGRAIEAIGGKTVQVNGLNRTTGEAGAPAASQSPGRQSGPSSQDQGNQTSPQQRGFPGGRRTRVQPEAPQP